jgi:secondary thiamine-phosphate synthase enzyme
MKQVFDTILIKTQGPGLYECSDAVRGFVRRSGIESGLLSCFIRHTSASLLVQENADPDVRKDLCDFFAHIAKEDMGYRHTAEGPDDMPSHIRSALTQTSLSIPVQNGDLALGTWQGIYVFEHRNAAHHRQVRLHLIGQ